MTIAHYIITGLLVIIVTWLLIQELKRVKAAKDLAEASKVTPPATA